jgi:hypothetical protein
MYSEAWERLKPRSVRFKPHLPRNITNNKKTCLLPVFNLLSNINLRRPWDTDTPTRDYSNSSEAMLVDWLLVHGNYARWKGNSNGVSKREIQQEIGDIINRKGKEMGIQRCRTADQVGSKIAWCELKFRETKQWIENTGQGILEEIGEDSFESKVEKERFRHYYTLLPIMAERACMGATVTTDGYLGERGVVLHGGEVDADAATFFENEDDDIDADVSVHQSPVRNIVVPAPPANANRHSDDVSTNATSTNGGGERAGRKGDELYGDIVKALNFSKEAEIQMEQEDRRQQRITEREDRRRQLEEVIRHNQLTKNV